MKDRIGSLLGVFLLLIGLGCAVYKGVYRQQGKQHQRESRQLAEAFHPRETPRQLPLDEAAEPDFRAGIESLKEHNQEVVGWIFLEGTSIDYPVVQTVNNDFYLTHSWDKEPSRHGALFLDYRVNGSQPGSNQIVYGHNMKDGTMLAELSQYSDPSFYEQHPSIYYITEEGVRETYHVIGVFYWDEGITSFRFDAYPDVGDEKLFQEYVTGVKQHSLYATRDVEQKNQKLLTLSTCDYRTKNSRLVVVGQQEAKVLI